MAEDNFSAGLVFLITFIDEFEIFRTSLRRGWFGLIFSQGFRMFFERKFLVRVRLIDAAVGESGHPLQKISVPLVFLLKEGVDAGKSLDISALVMLSTSVFNLLVIMQLQPRENFLGVSVTHK